MELEMSSTNAQILHILRNADKPMDAHSIYVAGAFEYEVQCYNGLANLSKRGLIERDKQNKVFHYWPAKDAELPDYLQSDLKIIEEKGMPKADPGRRIGLSRTEYESKDKNEKREAETARSTFHRVTTVEETTITHDIPVFLQTQELPKELPVVIEQIEQPEPPKLLKAPTESIFVTAIKRLEENRSDLDAKLNNVRLLALMSSGADRLVFLLRDYIYCLECAMGSDEIGNAELLALIKEAKELIVLFEKQERPLFQRAAFHLREWGFINDDCGAGDISADGDKRRAEATECYEIAAMLDP